MMKPAGPPPMPRPLQLPGLEARARRLSREWSSECRRYGVWIFALPSRSLPPLVAEPDHGGTIWVWIFNYGSQEAERAALAAFFAGLARRRLLSLPSIGGRAGHE